MDKKAQKGYLVGYDGDERYRIYIIEEHKVILSRDVKFEETLTECDAQVELPFREIETKEEFISSNSKLEDKKEEIDENKATNNDNKEEHSIKNSKPCLRDSSLRRKPKHLEDFITAAEEFVNVVENPETYEDALKKNSQEWIKAMDC